MVKITEKEFNEFFKEYNKEDYQYLRFGQAFFNKFINKNEDEFDNIFYEPSFAKVVKTILTHYVDNGSDILQRKAF
jgi:hypothetical protein